MALRAIAEALLRENESPAGGDYVDARSAIKYRLSPRAFREAINRGELLAYDVKGRRVARSADVRAFVERHPVVPKPEVIAEGRDSADSVDAKIQRLLDAGRLRSIRPR